MSSRFSDRALFACAAAATQLQHATLKPYGVNANSERQADYCTPPSADGMRNHGGASSRRRNSAISGREHFQVLCCAGGTISRIIAYHWSGAVRGWLMYVRRVFERPQPRWQRASNRCRKGFMVDRVTRPSSDGRGCIFRFKELTEGITKLRFASRKTRPSGKTVITLGLRKNAPDGNRCREGDAYSAQIRQSRCHCAGISFV